MKNKIQKSILEKMTPEQIESVTQKIAKKKNIPLVASKQVNMRLSPETMKRAKKLAELEGKAVTSFLAALLKEDIERLWKVVSKVDKAA